MSRAACLRENSKHLDVYYSELFSRISSFSSSRDVTTSWLIAYCCIHECLKLFCRKQWHWFPFGKTPQKIWSQSAFGAFTPCSFRAFPDSALIAIKKLLFSQLTGWICSLAIRDSVNFNYQWLLQAFIHLQSKKPRSQVRAGEFRERTNVSWIVRPAQHKKEENENNQKIQSRLPNSAKLDLQKFHRHHWTGRGAWRRQERKTGV